MNKRAERFKGGCLRDALTYNLVLPTQAKRLYRTVYLGNCIHRVGNPEQGRNVGAPCCAPCCEGSAPLCGPRACRADSDDYSPTEFHDDFCGESTNRRRFLWCFNNRFGRLSGLIFLNSFNLRRGDSFLTIVEKWLCRFRLVVLGIWSDEFSLKNLWRKVFEC